MDRQCFCLGPFFRFKVLHKTFKMYVYSTDQCHLSVGCTGEKPAEQKNGSNGMKTNGVMVEVEENWDFVEDIQVPLQYVSRQKCCEQVSSVHATNSLGKSKSIRHCSCWNHVCSLTISWQIAKTIIFMYVWVLQQACMLTKDKIHYFLKEVQLRPALSMCLASSRSLHWSLSTLRVSRFQITEQLHHVACRISAKRYHISHDFLNFD